MSSPTPPQRTVAKPSRGSESSRVPEPARRPRLGTRHQFRLNSLHAQMALGSALVALAAVVVVAIGSLVGVSVSQRNQARAELAAEVSQLARALGSGSHISSDQGSFGFPPA